MDGDVYHSMQTLLDSLSFNEVGVFFILQVLLLLLLLVLSALISGSEVAYFSLPPQDIAELEESEQPKAKRVLALLRAPQDLLATILIANNFVNVAIIMLSAFLSKELIDYGEQTILKFVIETIIITALILFFGEVMPKIFAKQHRKSFAKFVCYMLSAMQVLFKPLSYLLMKSTNIVSDSLAKRRSGNISMGDLEEALQLTQKDLSEEKDMLSSIVKFTNLTAVDIMTPRMDVVSLDIKDLLPDVLKTVVESGYSRIPVYDERPDEVKGILYVKDLLQHINEPDPHYNWQSLLRNPYFIPETKKVNELLQDFQGSKTHLAVVVDEYGGMQGIVSLEDILEEIVGEISDELDEEEEQNYIRQADGSIIFEAKISLNDFFKITGVDQEEFDAKRGDAETLAGFLLEINGLIPQKKEIIKYSSYSFEVVSSDARRIKKVKFKKNTARA